MATGKGGSAKKKFTEIYLYEMIHKCHGYTKLPKVKSKHWAKSKKAGNSIRNQLLWV